MERSDRFNSFSFGLGTKVEEEIKLVGEETETHWLTGVGGNWRAHEVISALFDPTTTLASCQF